MLTVISVITAVLGVLNFIEENSALKAFVYEWLLPRAWKWFKKRVFKKSNLIPPKRRSGRFRKRALPRKPQSYRRNRKRMDGNSN